MTTLSIPSAEIGVFLAILLRVGLVLFMIPVFSSSEVPRTVKVFISIALTALLHLLLRRTVPPLPFQTAAILKIALGEIAFAAIIALSFLVIFASFQFAGELISFQMGFGFVQVVDPQSGNQITVLSRWFQLLAILLFFSMDAHHLVLKALVESFSIVPLGGFVLTTDTLGKFILLSGQIFIIGMKMAAPVMIILFLTHIAFGLVARFSPEINILIVSFPLTILLGLFALCIFIPVCGSAVQRFIAMLFRFLYTLMEGT